MDSLGSKSSIPREIIFEIFSWLPTKSLMRFKCVTKFCNSLVSESDFVDIHGYRSITRPDGTKFFLHEKRAFYTAEQKEDGKIGASLFQTARFDGLYGSSDSSWLDCVNGLFCVCEPLSLGRAAVFNPSTREVRFLPNLNEEFSLCNYALGFESKENKYKVLLSTYHVREGGRKNWVLTLGIDEEWRETQSIYPGIFYSMPGVCISGVIYRFIYQSAMSNRRDIAAFDIKSEKFNIIELWNSSHHKAGDYKLIEVKGKLAVTDCENWLTGYIRLWILENIKKEDRWKSHIISFSSIWNVISPKIESSLRIICFCKSRDGEIIFIVNLKPGFLCLCYDVTTKSWRKVKIKGLPSESYIVGGYSYVESLVPCG
ncbi:putative F-box protein At1g47730 [Lycium ferocissimum]|uniref:putative F-box protein At1g47730 n=1 Tax=Lycium ferocissimum TaxID=112874 RepID=UPI002816600C|nr:putative F-box protein At1g47730 [Lycium ferocissimum]